MSQHRITMGCEEVPGADDEVLFDLDVSVDPGDPGCRYTRNGDGWPPEPAHIDEVKVRISPKNKTHLSDPAAAIAWMECECEKDSMLDQIADLINEE